MELDLSYLLDAKEIEIKIGANSFTGVVTAHVIDLVQNISNKKLEKALGKNNIKMKSANKKSMEKMLDNIDINLSQILSLDAEDCAEIIEAFFGKETYKLYVKAVEPLGLAFVNKKIFEKINMHVQEVTEANADEKNV